MKSLIAGLMGVVTLSGCVAVPYEPAPVGYYYSPSYPAPYYGPYYSYYYAPPAPAVSLSYSYHRRR